MPSKIAPEAPPTEEPEDPPFTPEVPPDPEVLEEPGTDVPETPETPADPSAEAPDAATLQARLAELEAENARLKAQDTRTDPEPPPPPAHQPVSAGRTFVSQVLPEAKKRFTREQATIDDQFDTIVQTTNQLVGAALQDHVTPAYRALAANLIEVRNELEIRDLRRDEDFVALEPQVRAILQKMPWEDRAEPRAVAEAYAAVTGKAALEKKAAPLGQRPATPASPSTPPRVVRDVASPPSGRNGRPQGVTLTPAQEADRKAIEQSLGQPCPPAVYAAKYKARCDRAKQLGKPVPKTFRD